MKTTPYLLLLLSVFSFGFRSNDTAKDAARGPVQVMTLGVFHFNYPNLDAQKTSEENQISVLDEPWQSQIKAIAKAIEQFAPTIIAIEKMPELQSEIDSQYQVYDPTRPDRRKNETYQLGFRIGNSLGIPKIWCIDDMGNPYPQIQAIMTDRGRGAQFEDYFYNSENKNIVRLENLPKIQCIIDELIRLNDKETIYKSLQSHLVHPFKYEENPGDFTGVDFESGRWFNRNLRIFRNIQRIPAQPEDRILIIIGSGHLNLLNFFIDVSPEFQLVSPIPYLEKTQR
jgi:hypothetical protein